MLSRGLSQRSFAGNEQDPKDTYGYNIHETITIWRYGGAGCQKKKKKSYNPRLSVTENCGQSVIGPYVPIDEKSLSFRRQPQSLVRTRKITRAFLAGTHAKNIYDDRRKVTESTGVEESL